MRRVICAANKFDDTIVLGARHFDKCMHTAINRLVSFYRPTSPSQWEQGFIDQFGVFMTREEAWIVACDEPGCKEDSTCGIPTDTGYRRTCGKHMPRALNRFVRAAAAIADQGESK